MHTWPTPYRRVRDLYTRDDGAALVELALLLPLLLVLVLGAVDYARLAVTGVAMSAAVRAGAQWGAQNTAESGNTARIKAVTIADFGTRYGVLSTSDVTVSVDCRCPSGTTVNCKTGTCAGYGTPPAYVSVSASKTVNFFIWAPGFGRSATTSRTAIIRVE